MTAEIARREVSLAEDQAAVRSEVKAFPDLKVTVDAMAMDVSRHAHLVGHGGLPPTGTRVEMRGITIWRLIDGRIHDEWTSFNAMGAYMQVLRRLQWLLLGALFVAILVVWQSGRWFERSRLRRGGADRLAIRPGDRARP